MRVLFVTYPEKTHFLAMVPLAWALRCAGHEVRVASQPDFAGTINQAGLTAVGVGRNLNIDRMLELDPDWESTGRTTVPEPYDVAVDPAKADFDYLADGYDRQLTRWHRVENVPLVPDLMKFARAWQPDLVIWEPTTYAGAIAGHVSGAAHARILFGLDLHGATRQHYLRLRTGRPVDDRRDPLAAWLASYTNRYGSGYDETLTTGHFTIDQLPPGMQLDTGLPGVAMQFVPYGGAATVPDWLRTPPVRPRVALTLGMVATDRFGGYLIDMQDILHHLAGMDIDVVATLPDSERAKLHTVPGNARIVSYVPLQALIATCTAVIHHAGFGTLSTATAQGRPHLVIPGDIDGPYLADALAAAGVAIVVDSDQATGAAVRSALQRLLDSTEIPAAGHRLQQRIRTVPTPAQLVPELEKLTAIHRGR